MESFAFIGETLRRLRKELGKTLEDLGSEAGLGRGQLSRIENSRQEATLSTLAKILASQGVSRREFFRRYDLVEGEARALGKVGPPIKGQPAVAAAVTSSESARELQDVMGRFGAWFRALAEATNLAQGSIEMGDLVLTFQIASKGMAVVEPVEPLPAPVVADKPVPPTPRGGRKAGGTGKKPPSKPR